MSGLLRRGWRRGALLLLLSAAALAAERTDVIDATVAEFFRPYEHDYATLSPDGNFVALTEQVRGRGPAIRIIKIEDRTSEVYPVASSVLHAVVEMQWVSPKRLVFTTRSRMVGALDVGGKAVEVLLAARDIDGFQPEPILGPRQQSGTVGADMPADPTSLNPADFPAGDRVELTVQQVLAQARVTGDLFGSESKRESDRALRPYLLGLKPGSPTTMLVEVRSGGDLFSYRRGDRTKITVPANVYISDGPAPTPPSDVPSGSANDYGSYDISLPPAPLAVLELDTMKGRTHEIARDDLWRRTWPDHQGRLRLALQQDGRRFRYLYRAVDAKKWTPLDSLVKTPEPLGFFAGVDNLLGPRSVPLGFTGDGSKLFVASNVGRDTFSLRLFDPAQGRFEESFEVGSERFDLIEPTALAAGDVLRFDPHTHKLVGVHYATALRGTRWFDPAMAALQDRLSKQLAPLRCELREWNAGRTRFLVDLWSPGDPGGFAVVDTATGKVVRCGDRAPWLTEERRNPTQGFDLATAEGRRLTGFFTLPRHPRLQPPPLLVYFHDGPWFSETPAFNRGAQALAALGFAVLQLNYRGSSGHGHAHLAAIDGGLDRAVLADVQAVLARGAVNKAAVNMHLVAAFGNGIGGYLAVRMVQLAPETFRCAVAINAPGDLEAWLKNPEVAPSLLSDLRQSVFGRDRSALRAQSAVASGAGTKIPVLVVHGSANVYVPEILGLDLYRALKKGTAETTWLALPDEGHGGWSERTTARLFAELGRFFNATVYNYGVSVRKPEVVK